MPRRSPRQPPPGFARCRDDRRSCCSRGLPPRRAGRNHRGFDSAYADHTDADFGRARRGRARRHRRQRLRSAAATRIRRARRRRPGHAQLRRAGPPSASWARFARARSGQSPRITIAQLPGLVSRGWPRGQMADSATLCQRFGAPRGRASRPGRHRAGRRVHPACPSRTAGAVPAQKPLLCTHKRRHRAGPGQPQGVVAAAPPAGNNVTDTRFG